MQINFLRLQKEHRCSRFNNAPSVVPIRLSWMKCSSGRRHPSTKRSVVLRPTPDISQSAHLPPLPPHSLLFLVHPPTHTHTHSFFHMQQSFCHVRVCVSKQCGVFVSIAGVRACQPPFDRCWTTRRALFSPVFMVR